MGYFAQTRREVNDVQRWLASSTREEVFAPLGVTNIRTFVAPQGSNRVGMTMEIPDMDAVMSMAQSDAGAEAMARDGVHPDSMVILVAS
ncbi:MAG: hypothetical protein ACYCXW_04140 [Solirubrobacteraceae bacterium]